MNLLDVFAKSVRRFKLFLIVVLALLSAAYLGKGFWVELFHNGGRFPGAQDLWRRWVEQQYIYRGINPYDAALSPKSFHSSSGLPAPTDVDYPPWSYLAGFLFFWPSWPTVRFWYGLINLLCLGYIVFFLFRFTRGEAPEDRALLLLSITAISAFCTTIGTGNYGVIILALLFAWADAEEARRDFPGGLFLGVAALKPNMCGPFLLVPMFQGRIRVLIGAAIYLGLASCVIWSLTKTNPIIMMIQMIHAARRFPTEDAGPLIAFVSIGVPYAIALPVTIFVSLAIFAPLIMSNRNSGPLVTFAIAGVASRLWTYNPNYSNMILVFLLLALWRLNRARPSGHIFAIFIVTASSLWVPPSFSNWRVYQVAEILIWSVSLAFLLYSWPIEPQSEILLVNWFPARLSDNTESAPQ